MHSLVQKLERGMYQVYVYIEERGQEESLRGGGGAHIAILREDKGLLASRTNDRQKIMIMGIYLASCHTA